VTTPEVTPEAATVRVETTIVNGSGQDQSFSLRSKLFAPDGRDICHLEFRIVDAQGVRVLDAAPELRFALVGPATTASKSPLLASLGLAVVMERLLIPDLLTYACSKMSALSPQEASRMA